MPEKRKIPKVDYAGKAEKMRLPTKAKKMKLDTATEVALMGGARRTLTPQERDTIRKVANYFGLPIEGITILGGRVYVNVTGLDAKVNQQWISKGWVKSEVSKAIQRASKENDWLAGYECIIRFFNQDKYVETVTHLAKNGNLTPELIKALRESFTVEFRNEGWATPDTCEAIAWKYEGEKGQKKRTELLEENVNMMAERKASNRAKRAAVGCGLTSVEEVIGIDSAAVDAEYEVREEEKKEEAQQNLFKEEGEEER